MIVEVIFLNFFPLIHFNASFKGMILIFMSNLNMIIHKNIKFIFPEHDIVMIKKRMKESNSILTIINIKDSSMVNSMV